jgi:hypothetical protein
MLSQRWHVVRFGNSATTSSLVRFSSVPALQYPPLFSSWPGQTQTVRNSPDLVSSAKKGTVARSHNFPILKDLYIYKDAA